MSKLVVFSSYYKELSNTAEITYCPPVKRNDLDKLEDKNMAVLILDGYFASQLAIPPMECIQALRAGMKLYGASSIGALRASELYPLGFYGLGRVYKGLKSNAIYKDSDLLCAYCAKTGQESSISMVHIKYALNKLLKQGKLQPEPICKVIDIAEQIYWPERNVEQLTKGLVGHINSNEINTVKACLVEPKFHPKKLDAIHALNTVKRIEGLTQ